MALSHLLKCILDVCQFTAFDLGELGTDLVLRRVERKINNVARCLFAKLLEHAQIPSEGLAQRVPALDEHFLQVQYRVFSCHDSLLP